MTNKSPYLLDASALLALIFEEKGAEKVAPAIKKGVVMTSVNVAEVLTKMVREGYALEEAELIYNMRISVMNVDTELASRAAYYDAYTRKYGLSLGDRICLAAAAIRKLPVLTADKTWKTLALKGVAVQLIR